MCDEKTKALVNPVLNNSISKAIEETNYRMGGDIVPVLEGIAKSLSGVSSIEELWGPNWILFLAIMADRICPIICFKRNLMGVKDITRRMTGYTYKTPISVIKGIVGVRVGDIDMIKNGGIDLLMLHIKTTTLICEDLNIPSPLECDRIYSSLGTGVHPKAVESYWRANPEKHRSGLHLVTGRTPTSNTTRILYKNWFSRIMLYFKNLRYRT